MIIYTPAEPATTIPVIELCRGPLFGARDKRAAAEAVHRACRETGFFYVSRHGVSAALVEAQFDWARRFFDLPLADKVAIHMKRSPTTAGYEPMGGQKLDSQDAATPAAPPDVKESFYCGLELPADDPLSLRKLRGCGHNQWPAALPLFRA